MTFERNGTPQNAEPFQENIAYAFLALIAFPPNICKTSRPMACFHTKSEGCAGFSLSQGAMGTTS